MTNDKDLETGKNVVFISVAIHFARYQQAIGMKLKQRGVRVAYVTYSKEAENFLIGKGEESVYIPDFKYASGRQLSEEIARIEREYDVRTNLILFGDYDLWFKKSDDARKLMVQNFLFWEDYLSKRKPGMVIGSSERLTGLVPDIVCKKLKLRYCQWTRAVIPGRFLLTENPRQGYWTVLDDLWKKREAVSLTAEERKRAESIIKSITEEKKTVYLVVGTPRITLSQIGFFFKRLYLNIFVERFRNPYARVIGIAWDKTVKAFKKYFLNFLYTEPSLKQKYFFYPLHYEVDTQILVRAPQYADQVDLIKYVARCLPSDYKLIVKEHPNNISGLPLRDLRQIAGVENVKIVSPHTPSHDLIKNCKGIVTINSTVGWEGLLYQKPVICFGTCFYEKCGMVWAVRNLYELPGVIRNAIATNIVDRERLLRFVNAVIESTYPGEFNFYYGHLERNLNEENVSNIAKGIYIELTR